MKILKKRTLGIGLTLLSIAIWVGPIAAAFGSNGWSLKETVMPKEEEINDIQSRIEETIGGGNFSDTNIKVSNSSISGKDISLNLEMNSPFSFRAEILEFNFELYDAQIGRKIGHVEMSKEAIILKPEITTNISFQGSLSVEINGYNQIPDQITLSKGTIKFKASGITATFSIEETEISGAGIEA